jgi:hypothetical protein
VNSKRSEANLNEMTKRVYRANDLEIDIVQDMSANDGRFGLWVYMSVDHQESNYMFRLLL